jgi:hypothetical protein
MLSTDGGCTDFCDLIIAASTLVLVLVETERSLSDGFCARRTFVPVEFELVQAILDGVPGCVTGTFFTTGTGILVELLTFAM